MPEKNIYIKGAREHNLKNIDLVLPRDKMIVFTGLSGSGKSSLAFDTIYAEGQRRYVESLSSYARQFLGQMEKPDVDLIDGLSPAISIDQKTTSKNPRSTVGTITEVYDYLRLLYARIGVPHCTVCGREIKPQTVDMIVDKIMTYDEGTKFQLLSPIARGKKGEFLKELEQVRKSGFVRVRIDGIIYDLSENIKLEKNKKHNIEVVVDRLVMKSSIRSRLTDSVETATKLSGGLLLVERVGVDEQLYSLNYACPEHGISFDELTPRMFSFNNPFGACKKCSGLGVFMKISEKSVIPDPSLSIRKGGIRAHGWNSVGEGSIAGMYYTALGKKYGFTLDTPIKDMSKSAVDAILYGTKGEKMKMERPTSFGGGVYYTDFEGIINNLQRRYNESGSEASRAEIEQLMTSEKCPDCGGARLCKEALSVTVGGKNIDEVSNLSIDKSLEFIDSLNETLSDRDLMIGRIILKEISDRLRFLSSVGLGYLTLARSAGTLSGGESQRIRLATQLGTSLMGVLYILDEPSIGLHQRDNEKLINTLKHLRDLGNTLIVVEHDEDTIRSADYVVDFGPAAGINGGEIVCSGSVQDIIDCESSITGQYLCGKKKIPVPGKRRSGNGKFLKIFNASENNLKGIDVTIPLGEFVCVTGVSGSGKSSLVNEILYKHLASELNNARKFPGKFDRIEGTENLDKIINIDQSPIGRTPRSNPATYTGVFNDIRELFANTVDAKMKGYTASRFSFNVKGGRCEACSGDGIVKIEMHFLADIFVPCDVCKGRRYNSETLAVKYKGKSIYDVLEMTVVEGMSFFENIPRVYKKLKTLYDVGLGYIKIGQPATTLSGGEAQRVKLSTELSKRATGKTVYVLDEPTTGLHTADVHRLVEVLHALVDAGNSVVVIEHNLDVIKTADYIIDLGPEGGDGGGTIVAEGTPEQIAEVKNSYTGQYLKKML
ncbi:MAG: excinuclease ABC subunit UvrA [Clostridiaceae bacterium]|nr:excinuclease ABC subunit UvrA [Clostridiaceae bacterium]MDY5990588.1 excinuclease ABC subunit UvrA [Oscillospiraceae bacterium]